MRPVPIVQIAALLLIATPSQAGSYSGTYFGIEDVWTTVYSGYAPEPTILDGDIPATFSYLTNGNYSSVTINQYSLSGTDFTAPFDGSGSVDFRGNFGDAGPDAVSIGGFGINGGSADAILRLDTGLDRGGDGEVITVQFLDSGAPEPSSLVMLALGLAAVAVAGHRRWRRFIAPA